MKVNLFSLEVEVSFNVRFAHGAVYYVWDVGTKGDLEIAVSWFSGWGAYRKAVAFALNRVEWLAGIEDAPVYVAVVKTVNGKDVGKSQVFGAVLESSVRSYKV